MRHLIDALQLRLHLMAFHRLASFIGRWGTDAQDANRGLRAFDYDPLWNRFNGIEAKDIQFPVSKHDIN